MEPQDQHTSDNSSSLEGSGSTLESNAPTAVSHTPVSSTSLDSSSSSLDMSTTPASPQAEGPKPPFFKRMWQRVNIYFLLFVVVFLIGTAIAIGFFIKDKAQNPTGTTINPTNLTPSQLQQLASSDTTVGTPKQTLNIQSNAIFTGTVLVRKDLEVAGNIRMNGSLALPGLTVSGLSSFNQLQAGSIVITGSTTVQGSFTAKSGINVTGNSNISGSLSATQIAASSLQLNGDLVLTHHITGGGPIPNLSQGIALGGGGTASVSGSDTSGSITINTGSSPAAGCFATITFARGYASTPHVIVTPIGAAASGLQYYVNRSTSSFSVCTTSPAAAGQTFGFDYIIMN